MRIVASNLTSGQDQAYEAHGLDILRGVSPDIVLIQEFNYLSNSASDLRAMVTSTFGPEFVYTRETGAQIPNGVISRYPITASGKWEDVKAGNREFVYARIDIPGDVDLWAISVHLLTANAATRDEEAGNLMDYISANIPSSDYVVLGGDFNTGMRNEAALSTLSPRFFVAGPYPVDQGGDGDTNSSRSKPYDWVLSSHLLHSHETAVVQGGHTFSHGMVVDTRVYQPISELAPATSDDSGVTNMQHMAVVKDYLF